MLLKSQCSALVMMRAFVAVDGPGFQLTVAHIKLQRASDSPKLLKYVSGEGTQIPDANLVCLDYEALVAVSKGLTTAFSLSCWAIELHVNP